MRLLSLMTVLAGLLFTLQAEPQFGLGRKKDDKTKEDERDRKEKERDEKNLSRYEKLRAYTRAKFDNDLDFKDAVEEAWEELLREHSQRAYEKNTTMRSYVKTVNEDNWRIHEQVYDNLLVQNLVNRIGQKLVPEGSEKLMAFKVIPNPVPMAETLATGTIYISTGMISLLDSEAQLAYVLAHEMAHVQLEHWKERVMMGEGSEAYAADQQKKAATVGAIAGVGMGVLGGVLGGRRGGAGGAVVGAVGLGATGAYLGGLAGNLLFRPIVVNWDRVNEDAADEMAFKQTLNANYDVREVPKLYAALETNLTRDSRVGLGFLGDRRRITQRKEKAKDLIENAMKADIELRLQKGDMIGERAEFRNLMAELKRDNGIMAFYHDMYELARNNLRDALAVRDNDPAVHYFYGKVQNLTARTPSELADAGRSFQKAATLDYRNQNYGAFIHAAMAMVDEKRSGNEKEIVRNLDTYVTNHAKWMIENYQLRYFPPNLDTVYEYMRLYGDKGWRPKPPEAKDMLNYTQLMPMLPSEGSPVTVVSQPASGAVPAGASEAKPLEVKVPLPGGVKVPVAVPRGPRK